jgi:hypothetical protein
MPEWTASPSVLRAVSRIAQICRRDYSSSLGHPSATPDSRDLCLLLRDRRCACRRLRHQSLNESVSDSDARLVTRGEPILYGNAKNIQSSAYENALNCVSRFNGTYLLPQRETVAAGETRFSQALFAGQRVT